MSSGHYTVRDTTHGPYVVTYEGRQDSVQGSCRQNLTHDILVKDSIHYHTSTK